MDIHKSNIELIKSHISALEKTLQEYSKMELDPAEVLDLDGRKKQIKELKKLLEAYENGI